MQAILLIFALLVTRALPQAQKYKFERISAAETTTFICNNQDTVLYKIVLKNSETTPISFQLQSNTPYNSLEFISDSETTKRYGAYQVGGNCFVHSSDSLATKNAYISLILVLTGSGSSDFCKVSSVVVNQGLTTCPGGLSTTDLTTDILGFAGDQADASSFRSVLYKASSSRKVDYHSILALKVLNLAPTALSEKLVELMLAEPLDRIDKRDSVSLYNPAKIDFLNEKEKFNDFAYPINHMRYIQNLMVEDLSGYSMSPFTYANSDNKGFGAPPDVPEKSIQSVASWGDLKRPRTLMVYMYLSKVGEIGGNTGYTIEVESKGWRTSDAQTSQLRSFECSISYAKVGQFIFLVATINEEVLDVLQIEKNSVSGYLYLALSIGEGILYYTNPTTVVAKRYITLSAYEDGVLKTVYSAKQLDPQPLESLFTLDSANPSDRWTMVRLKAAENEKHNKLGFRIYEIVHGLGAYPFYDISSNEVPGFRQCFFRGFEDGVCLGMALMEKDGQAQNLKSIDGESKAYSISTGYLVQKCKEPYDDVVCMIPKSGNIVNLGFSRRTRMYENVLSVAEFEGLHQETRNGFYKVVNQLETEYLVPCPYDCKLKKCSKNFEFFFEFFIDFSLFLQNFYL